MDHVALWRQGEIRIRWAYASRLAEVLRSFGQLFCRPAPLSLGQSCALCSVLTGVR
jgi:hypothetical protein